MSKENPAQEAVEKKEEQPPKAEPIQKKPSNQGINPIQESKLRSLRHNISILAQGKIPLDSKGNEAYLMRFDIEDEENLNNLLKALETNKKFTGKLEIYSSKFKDTNGLQITNIIKNNCIKSLTIWNRNHPFSDRVSTNIGDALKQNTSLEEFIIFLSVSDISPIHLTSFLCSPKSNLKTFGYLKATQKLFESLSAYINNESKLKKLMFYYEPLKEVNLLYKKEISEKALSDLANVIENNSNITEVNIIPLEEKFTEDINLQLTQDIDTIQKTLQFSCDLVNDNINSESRIEQKFAKQNAFIDDVLDKIDREEQMKKNKIISVRSYLDRAIGELLSEALYNLEVQRKRYPDEKKFFDFKGSIRYVAQYLINNKK